jgi:hypothetical protein
MTDTSSMPEVFVNKLDSMTGKSRSDVTTPAIIRISLFAYFLAAQLKEANAKNEGLDLAIADANERSEKSKQEANEVRALLEENEKSKAVIQCESPMMWPMCDMASYNIIELNLYLAPPSYLRSV